MAKSKRKRVPKTVLKLPDLEQSKRAVLNSLTSVLLRLRCYCEVSTLHSGGDNETACGTNDLPGDSRLIRLMRGTPPAERYL